MAKDPFEPLKRSKEKKCLERIAQDMADLTSIADDFLDQEASKNECTSAEGRYSSAEKVLGDAEITQEVMKRFISELPELKDSKMFGRIGAFISAAANNALNRTKELTLDLRAISSLRYEERIDSETFIVSPLDHIGMHQEKGKLLIIGYCGISAGYRMRGGELRVEGNCSMYAKSRSTGGLMVITGSTSSYAGKEMQGGSLILKGRCGSYLGYKLKNGTILAEGDVGDGVGSSMEGGEIKVSGKCGEYVGSGMKEGRIILLGDYGQDYFANKISSNIGSGEIYHKGKLIAGTRK